VTDTTAIHFPQEEIEEIEDKLEEATGFRPATKKSIAEKALQALREKISRNREVEFP